MITANYNGGSGGMILNADIEYINAPFDLESGEVFYYKDSVTDEFVTDYLNPDQIYATRRPEFIFNPQGTHVILAGSDGALMGTVIFKRVNDQYIRLCQLNEAHAGNAEYSVDGKFLVVSSINASDGLYIYKVDGDKYTLHQRIYPTVSGSNTLSFTHSPDGKYLMFCYYYKADRYSITEDGYTFLDNPISTTNYTYMFPTYNSDGSLFYMVTSLSGSSYGSELHKVNEDDSFTKITNYLSWYHSGSPYSVAFNPVYKGVLAIAANNLVAVYNFDYETNVLTRILSTTNTVAESSRSVTFDPSGNYLAGTSTSVCRMYSVNETECLPLPDYNIPNSNIVTWNPVYQELIASYDNFNFRGLTTNNFDYNKIPVAIIDDSAMSSDGMPLYNHLAVGLGYVNASAGMSHKVKILKVDREKVYHVTELSINGAVSVVRYTRDGKYLIVVTSPSTSNTKRLFIYKIVDEEYIELTIPDITIAISQLSIHPNGDHFAFSTTAAEGYIQIYKIENDNIVRLTNVPTFTFATERIQYGLNGLYCQNYSEMALYQTKRVDDTYSSMTVISTQLTRVSDVITSSNGKYLAVSDGGGDTYRNMHVYEINDDELTLLTNLKWLGSSLSSYSFNYDCNKLYVSAGQYSFISQKNGDVWENKYILNKYTYSSEKVSAGASNGNEFVLTLSAPPYCMLINRKSITEYSKTYATDSSEIGIGSKLYVSTGDITKGGNLKTYAIPLI